MPNKPQIFVITSLTVLFIFGLLTTCSKNPKCWGDDKNSGLIISSININCEPITGQQQFFINTDSAYKQTFATNCNLPSVDFNTCSLLGLYAEGGCKVKFIRDVTRVNNENKYLYKVTVKECGFCKTLGFSYNWVTVPKIPSDWTVTYETENKQN